MGDGVECARVDAFGERIVDEKRRHEEQARIVVQLEPVALQCPEVIDVPQLHAQRLEDLTVTVAARSAERLLQMILQVAEYPVVVEKRVVDVEEKGDVIRC